MKSKLLSNITPGEILDEEFDAALNRVRAEDGAASGTPILHSIVDQVGEHLMNRFAVGQHGRKRFERAAGSFRFLDL